MSLIDDVKQRMDETLDAIRREFSTVRTGKATPALLDTVRVEAYGSSMPLNQVATISIPEGSLIVVQPFDKSLLQEVEKGIMQADLGLNPSNDGNIIRVPVPALNEERRREMVKLLSKMAEEGRVSIRHARREANDRIKVLMKEGDLSDDDGRRQLDQVQSLTDSYTQRVDELMDAKEEEIMTV
ncbi:MAG: ribosome recycling factor [Gemmatimonadales bacterium]|nr:MAG: ribosome recycling factor [Gemmatimonadales bacterium]